MGPSSDLKGSGQQIESIRFQWEWRSVGSVTLRGEELTFPTRADFPGVYRIIAADHEGSVAVYVGESGSISKRLQQYQNASLLRSGTDYKVQEEVYLALVGGGQVKVDAIRAAHLIAHNESPAALDLSNKHVRRMIEAAVLLNFAKQEVWVINAD